jgi:hypothetical protein
MLPVISFGSEELKQTYLPRICRGASQASYCLSEPDAGSDVASMTTKAERDGDHWVISGTKCWITNAGISDLYTVFARTSPDRHTGITCFLVEAGWGVQVEKLEHKLGIKGSPTGVIRLDEVRVPDTHRVGEVGQGFAVAMHTLDRSRPTIGAQAVGIAQGALDYALGYMNERRTFGRSFGRRRRREPIGVDAVGDHRYVAVSSEPGEFVGHSSVERDERIGSTDRPSADAGDRETLDGVDHRVVVVDVADVFGDHQTRAGPSAAPPRRRDGRVVEDAVGVHHVRPRPQAIELGCQRAAEQGPRDVHRLEPTPGRDADHAADCRRFDARRQRAGEVDHLVPAAPQRVAQSVDGGLDTADVRQAVVRRDRDPHGRRLVRDVA